MAGTVKNGLPWSSRGKGGRSDRGKKQIRESGRCSGICFSKSKEPTLSSRQRSDGRSPRRPPPRWADLPARGRRGARARRPDRDPRAGTFEKFVKFITHAIFAIRICCSDFRKNTHTNVLRNRLHYRQRPACRRGRDVIPATYGWPRFDIECFPRSIGCRYNRHE